MSTTIYNYELSPLVVLRVRKPEHNCSGSVLLQNDGVLWDCVECKECSFQKYIEAGWEEKYSRLYGIGDNIAGIVRENSDETNCKYCPKLRSSALVVNSNQCKLSTGEHEVVHFAWDDADCTLELLVTEHIEGNKCTIEHMEYTSLLLRFDPVLFVEPVVGLKRQLSWA